MTKMIENEVKNFRTELVETAESIIKRGMNDYDWLSVEEYLTTQKTNMEYFERIIFVKGESYFEINLAGESHCAVGAGIEHFKGVIVNDNRFPYCG